MFKDNCNGPILERAINCDLIAGLASRIVSSYFLPDSRAASCPKSPTHSNFSTAYSCEISNCTNGSGRQAPLNR